MSIEVSPIAGALGAEVTGIDLAKELTDEQVLTIRRAWLEHLVLFFRDQELSEDQYLAFAHRIGRPVRYPFVPSIESHPEIIEVLKLEHERVNFGGMWHTDTTYLDEPPMATMLLARQIPPFGGDTLFANQYLAYEGLSKGMRHLLDGLFAVNSSALADVSKTREDRMSGGEADHRAYEARHPVVRRHPETGRPALYVNGAHTARFSTMTEAESRPILDFLFAHQVRPEYTCRFRWSVGSLALWDNRCTQHNPVNDYHGYRRSLLRITMADEPSRYLTRAN